MRWVRYVSWLLYSMETLTIIQWRGVHNICEFHRASLLYETRNGSVSCEQPAKRPSYPASARAPTCWIATILTSATSGPTSPSWLLFTPSSTRWHMSSCGGDADRNKRILTPPEQMSYMCYILTAHLCKRERHQMSEFPCIISVMQNYCIS